MQMIDFDNEIPKDIQEILQYMSAELRHRVEADYKDRYAPFLAMLAGWKQAVAQHHTNAQDAAIERLQEAFFPIGHWNFPGQIVAVPAETPKKTTAIDFNASLTDVAKRPWMACGAGWLHPIFFFIFRCVSQPRRETEDRPAQYRAPGPGQIAQLLAAARRGEVPFAKQASAAGQPCFLSAHVAATGEGQGFGSQRHNPVISKAC